MTVTVIITVAILLFMPLAEGRESVSIINNTSMTETFTLEDGCGCLSAGFINGTSDTRPGPTIPPFTISGRPYYFGGSSTSWYCNHLPPH